MQLRGGEYTGRNISAEWHEQFKIMTDCLTDTEFVCEAGWGNSIQDKLADKISASSSGIVRTLKKMCENFGFYAPHALEARKQIDCNGLLTERGKLAYHAATLEMQVRANSGLTDSVKRAAIAEINKIYEEVYCEALKEYRFTNADGSYFYPLRATLRALEKYGQMDKWEWYLLNTFVRHNDDAAEESLLEEHISKYRNGEYAFSMQNVTENPKGHQYTPQYFEFAGLLNIARRPLWTIANSEKNADLKREVLGETFLDNTDGE